MLPHSDDVPYLLREIKLQAQQGQGLRQAAAFFNTTPEELDAWCRQHTPPQQRYADYASHIRTKYESDLLLKQQKLAQEGSPVAQRALLNHLSKTARRHTTPLTPAGLDQLEADTPPRTAVYVGPYLVEAGLVFTSHQASAYHFGRRQMEYAIILNPNLSEKAPYANLSVTFPTRLARDAAQQTLDAARLACAQSNLALFAPGPPRA